MKTYNKALLKSVGFTVTAADVVKLGVTVLPINISNIMPIPNGVGGDVEDVLKVIVDLPKAVNYLLYKLYRSANNGTLNSKASYLMGEGLDKPFPGSYKGPLVELKIKPNGDVDIKPTALGDEWHVKDKLNKFNIYNCVNPLGNTVSKKSKYGTILAVSKAFKPISNALGLYDPSLKNLPTAPAAKKVSKKVKKRQVVSVIDKDNNPPPWDTGGQPTPSKTVAKKPKKAKSVKRKTKRKASIHAIPSNVEGGGDSVTDKLALLPW